MQVMVNSIGEPHRCRCGCAVGATGRVIAGGCGGADVEEISIFVFACSHSQSHTVIFRYVWLYDVRSVLSVYRRRLHAAMSEGWTYHRAFPYSESARRERKVRVWQSHASKCDHRRPVTTASVGLGPKRHQASQPMTQLPTGQRPRDRLGGEVVGGKIWTLAGVLIGLLQSVQEHQCGAQRAISGKQGAVAARHRARKGCRMMRHQQPCFHPSIMPRLPRGPFLEFFPQRPFQQKAVNDAIPQARKADAIQRARRDAAQLKLRRNGRTTRYASWSPLAPSAPSKAAENDPLLFLTESDEDDTDDESSRRMSISELTKAAPIDRGLGTQRAFERPQVQHLGDERPVTSWRYVVILCSVVCSRATRTL